VIPEPLGELALRPWGRPRVGVIQHATAERLLELQPSFPIPGPNHVCMLRCAPERVDGMIDETRALIAVHGQPCLWILDPDARPADLGRRLGERGIVPIEELEVMVLAATAGLEPPAARIRIVDGLGDLASFEAAEAIQARAFGGGPVPHQRRRFEEGRADPARHLLLALLDGEPAGAGWATVLEAGVLMNGGAVDPGCRGRGVYRALVAERMRLALEAGAPGLATEARPDTAAPILAGLGFSTVGRWRLHEDRGAAGAS